jgi:ribosome modulation factor
LGDVDPADFESKKTFQAKDGIEGKLTTFKPYSHVRLQWKLAGWKDHSALQVRVIKAATKATISFHQDKLPDSNHRQQMKHHWDEVLARLSEHLQ